MDENALPEGNIEGRSTDLKYSHYSFKMLDIQPKNTNALPDKAAKLESNPSSIVHV